MAGPPEFTNSIVANAPVGGVGGVVQGVVVGGAGEGLDVGPGGVEGAGEPAMTSPGFAAGLTQMYCLLTSQLKGFHALGC